MATRIRRRESAYEHAHLADRVARPPAPRRRRARAARPCAPSRPISGRTATSCGGRARPTLERHHAGAAATTPRRRRRPPRPPRRSPASLRSAVWANPVVSPRTTRMPGAPFAPGDELLDLGRRRAGRCAVRRSSANTSAKSPPCRSAVRSVRSSTASSIKSPPAGLSIVGRCLCAPVCLLPSTSSSPTATPRSRSVTGDVPVLATPRVVTLAEEATVQAVDGELAEGTTSVGYRVQLDHLAPTAVGGHVRAEATLEAIEGRRLTFRVSVSDGHGLVAAGRITRVIVETRPFPGEGRGRLRRSGAVPGGRDGAAQSTIETETKRSRARRAGRRSAVDHRDRDRAVARTEPHRRLSAARRPGTSPSPPTTRAGSRTAANARHRAPRRARPPARWPRCRARARGTRCPPRPRSRGPAR